MVSDTKNGNTNKKIVQSQVIQILNKTNYSLNVVNRYKENIIHTCAANDCVDVIQCIIKKHGHHYLERKNIFGWTPLMQAIRNVNMETVKLLLNCGVTVNDFSFLGMSVLSLSCAISIDMFNLLHSSCPSALEYAAHDDINPLCVAALKSDKELFFKLINLGLDVSKANAMTHTMMKLSKAPEIVALAKNHLSSEDYWNDLSYIEDSLTDEESKDDENNVGQIAESRLSSGIPKIHVNLFSPKIFKNELYDEKKVVDLKLDITESKPKDLISPTLSYFDECVFPSSPNTFITQDKIIAGEFTKLALHVDRVNSRLSNEHQSIPRIENSTPISPLVLKRCRDKRPPNLKLRCSSNDSNATLSFTPQFSPCKTPNLPHDINEDNVFDDTTPTPPKYKTPPRGITQDPNTARLVCLLQKFGLKKHISTFLEQEVDLELFTTLTDKDLIEIGIDSKSERLIILSVINECKYQ